MCDGVLDGVGVWLVVLEGSLTVLAFFFSQIVSKPDFMHCLALIASRFASA
jgi:NADH:ubiquinone oxidoreductase subunit 4 (subunit M)